MLARSILTCGALLALCVPASAYTQHTLHSFCSEANCADGKFPNGGLVQDAAGNLFGTASAGGASGTAGVAFELVANEAHTAWTYKVIHDFCSADACSDGAGPVSGVIIDTAGNLYGTALGGGANNGGVVYKLSPGATQSDPWTIATLHDFCAPGDNGCADGYQPAASLSYAGAATGAPYDGAATLYGTTSNGGAHGGGNVYALTLKHGVWSEKPLYQFCAVAHCADGIDAQGGVTVGGDGKLYGTTFEGGAERSHGIAFQLTRQRGGGLWRERILQQFVPKDGINPAAAPALDAAGDLLGTTYYGGMGAQCPDKHGLPGSKKCGAVYKLTRAGNRYSETVLHRFCSDADCADGRNPNSGVLLDADGNLFGAATAGGGGHNRVGDIGGGVVYEFSDTYHVLYDFCSESNCADGSAPAAPIMDASGNLFGTTNGSSQASIAGTVYELTP
ncbi:MAG: hypothetical protein JOZ72_02225 [Alphaproteobacteria bacterium]|nr:hypothetical protein [Alphaproteobacteria bacterium]